MQILGFEYPEAYFYFLEHDMWCCPQEDGTIRVGVSGFGVHLSGDFFMCRPKAPGTVLVQGQTLGVVELSKSIVTVKTPVSGTVVTVNPLLQDMPELIHLDPYERGWLVDIAPDRWEQDLLQLAHGFVLEAAASVRMRLESMQFPPL
jgi:glycine cleavage system H protein